MINWLNVIGIIISFLAVIIPLYTWRGKMKQDKFIQFHENVLTKISNIDGKVGAWEQMAWIFALRNFPEYFPVTEKILLMCIKKWSKAREDESKEERKQVLESLIAEVEEALGYIQGNWWSKQCSKFRPKRRISRKEKEMIKK